MMKRGEVLREMRLTLLGVVALVAAYLFGGELRAGGLEQQAQVPPPAVDAAGITGELWGLATREAKLMGLLALAGIGAAIGFVRVARVWRPKPNPARYTVPGTLQLAYDEWLLWMQRAAVTSAFFLTFGLEMVFLDTMYGWGAKVTVAVVPALVAAGFVIPVYNRVHEWIKRRQKRRQPPHGGGGSDQPEVGDLTEL